MIELSLFRGKCTPVSTFSTLWHGDRFISFVIEDTYNKPKIKGKTRIYAGRYRIEKMREGNPNMGVKAKSLLQKYGSEFGHKWIARLVNVDQFDGILIHIGNKAENSEGCLMPNWLVTFDIKTNEFVGEASKTAYQVFYNYIDALNDDEIFIEVVD